MKIPWKTLASFLAFAILVILQYQNCSSYNDPSPFDVGNKNAASNSSPSDVRLDSPSGVIDGRQGDRALSMGGECNSGLSARNYIEIRMSDDSNQPIPVRQDSVACPPATASSNPDCLIAKSFVCEHGRYFIELPKSCAGYRNQIQSTYKVQGQLVTVDSSGNETRDHKASFERYFSIAWSDVDLLDCQ